MSKKKTSQFTDSDFVIKPQAPVDPEPNVVADTVIEDTIQEAETGFQIEEVAIPKRTGRKATNIFPIGKLTAGSNQSFLVPCKPEDVKKTTTRIRTFAYRNDFKVVLRTEENGVRVWRAEN